MIKSPRKNVPDVGIELATACMPSEHASDRATAPGPLCVNALLYLAQDNSILDDSHLKNLTHYNSALENDVLGNLVLNNTTPHDSVLYKSILDDSALDNSNSGVGRYLIYRAGLGCYI